MGKYISKLDNIKDLAFEIYTRLNKATVPIFVCIGCDKFVCDSLAPIVAEKLKHEYNISAFVYGGLDYNITASNLMECMNYIEAQHDGAQIITIDATLGENLGEIKLTKSCYPALAKGLPKRKIGDFGILGVVGKSSADFNLNSTRLKVVMNMADDISKAIAMAVSILPKCRAFGGMYTV